MRSLGGNFMDKFESKSRGMNAAQYNSVNPAVLTLSHSADSVLFLP